MYKLHKSDVGWWCWLDLPIEHPLYYAQFQCRAHAKIALGLCLASKYD